MQALHRAVRVQDALRSMRANGERTVGSEEKYYMLEMGMQKSGE